MEIVFRDKRIYIFDEVDERMKMYEVDIDSNSVYQIYPEFKEIEKGELPTEAVETLARDFLIEI